MPALCFRMMVNNHAATLMINKVLTTGGSAGRFEKLPFIDCKSKAITPISANDDFKMNQNQVPANWV
jgi:hypothetical protein